MPFIELTYESHVSSQLLLKLYYFEIDIFQAFPFVFELFGTLVDVKHFLALRQQQAPESYHFTTFRFITNLVFCVNLDYEFTQVGIHLCILLLTPSLVENPAH